MPETLVAVVSAYTLANSQLVGGISPIPMLKRAAILCDRIYMDTQGLGVPGGLLERKILHKLLGGESEGHDLLLDPEFRRLLLRPQDFGSAAPDLVQAVSAAHFGPLYSAALSVVEALPDRVLEPIAAPWRGVDYKARGALGIELTEDMYRPEALRPWLPNAVGLVTPLHTRVMKALGREWNGDPFPEILELAEKRIVDYGVLPWREILKLRRSSFVDEFRDRMKTMRSESEGSVMNALWSDLWRFAQENRPSPRRTLLSGVLGNLPLPLVLNPVSVAQSVRDVWRANHQEGSFGWLYFVMETPGARLTEWPERTEP